MTINEFINKIYYGDEIEFKFDNTTYLFKDTGRMKNIILQLIIGIKQMERNLNTIICIVYVV